MDQLKLSFPARLVLCTAKVDVCLGSACQEATDGSGMVVLSFPASTPF